ncbi:MAG: FMN-binding protein [Spirochaetales bacterium]|nr:FMN-binding protein [Spirochaetales bacterium]
MKNKKNLIFLSALIPFAFLMATSFGGNRGSNYDKPTGMDLTGLTVADGVYTGEATGFREGLVVEVTVTGGTVSEVEVVDHNEVGAQYYTRPVKLIPKLIVDEQKTNVDGVTGASATSYAIMSAVENALSGAAQ